MTFTAITRVRLDLVWELKVRVGLELNSAKQKQTQTKKVNEFLLRSVLKLKLPSRIWHNWNCIRVCDVTVVAKRKRCQVGVAPFQVVQRVF